MSLAIEVVTAGQIAPLLPELARLRIAVFCDFPYLYDGDLTYERNYLNRFSKAAGAIIVIARDGDRIVGAATGAPLTEVDAEFAAPFRERAIDITRTFYCAESVLLSDYRGQGAGHAFFDYREDHARALGAEVSCFCSVIRPPEHPLKPAAYRPLDGFWQKRGYMPRPDMTISLDWKDVGEPTETTKKLQVWSMPL